MKSPFQRIRQSIARIDLPVALAVPALVGVLVVLGGVVMEQNGELALARHAGYAALDAYRATQHAMHLSLAQWIGEGIAGSLTAFGSNVQARGVALMFGLPLVALTTVLAARLTKETPQTVTIWWLFTTCFIWTFRPYYHQWPSNHAMVETGAKPDE